MTLCKVIDQPAAVVLRHMSPQVQQARVLNYIDKHVQVSANTCTAVSAELRMVTSAAGLAKALSQTLQRTMWLRKSTAWVLLFYETLLRGEGFRCSDATAALFWRSIHVVIELERYIVGVSDIPTYVTTSPSSCSQTYMDA